MEASAELESAPSELEDYVRFLRTVGYGVINNRFMLYGGLVDPDEIYDAATSQTLAGLRIFGDDLAGVCYAFSREGVVEIDELHEVSLVTSTFDEFLRGRLL